MPHRLIATLIAALGTVAVSHAEPLRCGWTLTSSSGTVLGSSSGLEAADVNFGLLPAPVLPSGPAKPSDPSYYPNLHVKSATSTATLTLTDEGTNMSQGVLKLVGGFG